MIADIPQNLILMTVGAFLLGWILASISARLGSGRDSTKRDPRDDRIRSLEADLRVASSSATQASEKLKALEEELEEIRASVEKRDNVITHQQERMEELKRDLKESVMKTRELRHELSDRAAENVKSEVKLREVETELSIAQASTDLLATGVLDYSVAPDGEDDDAAEASASRKVPKAAT